MSTSFRIVLDTNVVLSALLFEHGRLAWLRTAWQQGRITPLVCRETTSELLRVLAYPKFKLTGEERQDLLAEFLPYAEVLALPNPWPVLPACRDTADQAFLVLAHAAGAEALITGDADLLEMLGTFPNLIHSAQDWAGSAAGLAAALRT